MVVKEVIKGDISSIDQAHEELIHALRKEDAIDGYYHVQVALHKFTCIWYSTYYPGY